MDLIKQRILCVDDDPLNLKLFEAVLVQNGYEVIMAENSREAIERIAKQRIDLALLDVMMPGISGLDLCRMIKEDNRFKNIPVIMLTGLTLSEIRTKCIESGADDIISKPFNLSEVLARIKMLLNMKELKDKLDNANTNVNILTSFTEDIVNTFNLLTFNFMASLTSLVNQIIKKTEDKMNRPQLVVIGILDERNNWKWYKYEFINGKLERKLIRLNLQDNLDIHKNTPRVVFYNNIELKNSEYMPFVRRLESTSLIISNMVCYISDDFSILTLNYGRNVTEQDASVLNSIVKQSLYLKDVSSQIRETEDAFAYTIYILARLSDAADEETSNHILRVGEYSAKLAERLRMSEIFVREIRIQGQMHDVGKIHILPEILKKPKKLTVEEFDEVKKHTIHGANILGDHSKLSLAKTIALTHHERWDGSGYPYGLKEENIPIEGRILNIADQYDALRNKTAYRSAYDHEKVYRIITEGDGRTMPYHFDPQVLKAFKETASQFKEIYEIFKN